MAEKIRTMSVDQHPVGSIYQSVLPTDPSELFGGTWTQLKDRFLLAAGDTYAAGSTGGEAQHTLTEAEMPSHLHDYVLDAKGEGATGSPSRWYVDAGTIGSKLGKVRQTSLRGGSQPHNNLPPYLAVYTWVRVA